MRIEGVHAGNTGYSFPRSWFTLDAGPIHSSGWFSRRAVRASGNRAAQRVTWEDRVRSVDGGVERQPPAWCGIGVAEDVHGSTEDDSELNRTKSSSNSCRKAYFSCVTKPKKSCPFR